jgi:nucleotide-binding universal stress UspA family protein
MVSYERILVPTDGSAGTEETVAHGLAVAGEHGAAVHALYVVDTKLLNAAGDEREDVASDLRAEGRDAVARVADAADERGLSAVTEVREGVPHREILRYVDEAAIDLVAMGTHGRTGPDKVVNMGSVTERVIENAGVPVLAVQIGGFEGESEGGGGDESEDPERGAGGERGD